MGNGARPRCAEQGRGARTGSGTAPTACKPDVRALPDRAVARRRRCRRHPRVRPGHEGLGQGRLLPCPRPRARWAGATPITSTSAPISAPGSMTTLRLSAHRQGMEARHAAGAARRVVYEGQAEDMYIAAMPRPHAGLRARLRQPHARLLQRRAVPARQRRQARARSTRPTPPTSRCTREWLMLELREPLDSRRQDLRRPAALLAAQLRRLHGRQARVHRAVRADRHAPRWPASPGRENHLVLNVLEDVKNRSACSRPADGGVEARDRSSARPTFGTVGVGAVDADDSDAVWLTVTDYLTPTTLSLARRSAQAPEVLKTMPAFFDGSEHVDRTAFRHLARTAPRAVLPGRPKNLEARRQASRPCCTATAASRSR